MSISLIPKRPLVLLSISALKLKKAYVTWDDTFQLYNYILYEDSLEDYEKALPVLRHNGEFRFNYGKALLNKEVKAHSTAIDEKKSKMKIIKERETTMNNISFAIKHQFW